MNKNQIKAEFKKYAKKNGKEKTEYLLSELESIMECDLYNERVKGFYERD